MLPYYIYPIFESSQANVFSDGLTSFSLIYLRWLNGYVIPTVHQEDDATNVTISMFDTQFGFEKPNKPFAYEIATLADLNGISEEEQKNLVSVAYEREGALFKFNCSNNPRAQDKDQLVLVNSELHFQLLQRVNRFAGLFHHQHLSKEYRTLQAIQALYDVLKVENNSSDNTMPIVISQQTVDILIKDVENINKFLTENQKLISGIPKRILEVILSPYLVNVELEKLKSLLITVAKMPKALLQSIEIAICTFDEIERSSENVSESWFIYNGKKYNENDIIDTDHYIHVLKDISLKLGSNDLDLAISAIRKNNVYYATIQKLTTSVHEQFSVIEAMKTQFEIQADNADLEELTMALKSHFSHAADRFNSKIYGTYDPESGERINSNISPYDKQFDVYISDLLHSLRPDLFPTPNFSVLGIPDSTFDTFGL